MKTLYFECGSGISGDMCAAALLDTGLVSKEYLLAELKKLTVDGYEINIYNTYKAFLAALKFDVVLKEDAHHHDHDDESPHSCEHRHEHGHAVEHTHRNLQDIENIIVGSGITDGAKNRMSAAFRLLAQAEAKAHGIDISSVYFHEVGAVDSIVDIAAASILLDKIAPDRITASVVCEGFGQIECRHGFLPVPVPATANIFEMKKIPYRIMDVQGEMVTPTGAAILGAFADEYGARPEGVILSSGIGAGTKDFPHANILRVFLTEDAGKDSDVSVLEANIDDATGEELSLCMELLMEAGALDASCIPAMMKKGRPGHVLTIMCRPEDTEKMAALIFAHSSTIGLRLRRSERIIMQRTKATATTAYGPIGVKIASYEGTEKYKAEYEDVAKIAKEFCISYRTVAAAAEAAAKATKEK